MAKESAHVRMRHVPMRSLAPRERAALKKLDAKGTRGDAPASLSLAHIKASPALFQPRFDSIAYAPGRSESHIAELSKVVRAGGDLDPLTVIAFGQEWYLIDGHHRWEAYSAGGRLDPVSVRALTSSRSGDDRIAWATEASFADNKKNTLNLSNGDKCDGAWRAILAGEAGSKKDTAEKYGVSQSLVGQMRATKRGLEDEGAHTDHLYFWRSARSELARLKAGDSIKGGSGFDEQQRRKLARQLKGVMDMRPDPAMLAEALEAYEPGIVSAMMLAANDDDGDDIGDF